MTILLICLKIFFARIIDVCLGTFRTICIVKGKRLTSALIAFIEVLIWFMIAREALNYEITSWFIPVSYASGFATGTYLGIYLSSKIIGGHLTLNVISSVINQTNINELKRKGYGVSVLKTKDNKTLLIMSLAQKHFTEAESLLKEMDENVFIIVNETKALENGYIK